MNDGLAFSPAWREVLDRLSQEPAVRVSVEVTEGSVPREMGAWMAVFADTVVGTVGGGQLEWQAMAWARQHLLRDGWSGDWRRYPLGPTLGQCCGGVVTLRFEPLTVEKAQSLAEAHSSLYTPVVLFGGGHVGQAIVQALQPLPFALTWLDSRDGVFPPNVAPNVRCEHSDPVHAAVATLVPGSLVLVMSFSHAEDLDIVAACLHRQRHGGDLPFVGLIGSRTKWAAFRHRLEQRGFRGDEIDHITCPIGVPGIVGKQPAVIAASVAVQLLRVRPPVPA